MKMSFGKLMLILLVPATVVGVQYHRQQQHQHLASVSRNDSEWHHEFDLSEWHHGSNTTDDIVGPEDDSEFHMKWDLSEWGHFETSSTTATTTWQNGTEGSQELLHKFHQKLLHKLRASATTVIPREYVGSQKWWDDMHQRHFPIKKPSTTWWTTVTTTTITTTTEDLNMIWTRRLKAQEEKEIWNDTVKWRDPSELVLAFDADKDGVITEADGDHWLIDRRADSEALHGWVHLFEVADKDHGNSDGKANHDEMTEALKWSFFVELDTPYGQQLTSLKNTIEKWTPMKR
eukprot:TRINITY_DN6772_c2_g1_i1.p1 TRINITY_DN6772_c2_g1~~TRINITY_DN6772_c2_g1_i1.p1  ORF type:complete len:289 (+),score=42.55 TRINITY_DN6772_c2_g1_i1:167-1033(+)